MINHDYGYVALGCFRLQGGGWYAVSGEMSFMQGLDEAQVGVSGLYDQVIEVPESEKDNYAQYAGKEEHVHSFEQAWTTDENNHWHKCTAAGASDECLNDPGAAKGAHVYDGDTCEVCGYKKAQDAEIVSIEFTMKPAKVVYELNEKLDLTGGGIVAMHKDGLFHFVDLTEDMVSGIDSSKPGVETLTVTYEGCTVTYDVTIVDKLVFTDIDPVPGDWIYDAAMYVYDKGIMTGMTPTTFGPAEKLSPAQFATILYRMSGEAGEYKQIFPDVNEGDWFGIPVAWANQAGVITGYQNGYFGPGDDITREQLAVMLYRYEVYKGYDVSGKADLSKYPDAGSVSDWAVEAMEWAVGSGIITGKDGGKYLDPQGNASRAECATMIMRFMQKYVG